MDFTTTLLSTALSLIWFAAEQREQSPGGFRKARRIGGSLLGVPIFLLLVVLGSSARATTYAVSPTGSDGASGLLSAPWKTIGHAMSVVAADDTVNITAGTYNETPVMSRSGQSGQPINFVGVGNPIMVTSGDVFKVTGSFINFTGITFHSANNSSSSSAYVPDSTWCYSTWTSGSHITFTFCIWENMASPSAHWGDSDAADYCAVRLDGTANTLQGGCILRNLQDMDAIGCGFGTVSTDCTIKNTECYNITNPNYSSGPNGDGPHSDWFQDGGSCIRFLIDSCYVHDCGAHVGVYGSDITTRNSIFVNIDNGFFVSGNGVKFYNNTFYNAGYQQGSPTVFAGYDVVFVNNIVYYSTGGSFIFGSSAGQVSNNYDGGAPGFLNGSGGFNRASDFGINSSSPAKGAGATLSPVFADYNGFARTDPWAIGAFAFGSVLGPTPTPTPVPTPNPPMNLLRGR